MRGSHVRIIRLQTLMVQTRRHISGSRRLRRGPRFALDRNIQRAAGTATVVHNHCQLFATNDATRVAGATVTVTVASKVRTW